MRPQFTEKELLYPLSAGLQPLIAAAHCWTAAGFGRQRGHGLLPLEELNEFANGGLVLRRQRADERRAKASKKRLPGQLQKLYRASLMFARTVLALSGCAGRRGDLCGRPAAFRSEERRVGKECRL